MLAFLHRVQRLDDIDARSPFLDIAKALATAHAAGYVHRDVRLEHIYLTSRGVVVLGDWGFSCSTKDQTAERLAVPINVYSSPEIINDSSFAEPSVDSWGV